MNTLFLASNGAAGNNIMMIVLFIGLAAFTYFGMIRPQKKQQQQRMQMMDKLKKGDSVVLVDGLHAKVDKINSDKTIVVDADGIYLTFERMAVRRVIPAATIEEHDDSAAKQTETAAKDDVNSSDKAADDEKKADK